MSLAFNSNDQITKKSYLIIIYWIDYKYPRHFVQITIVLFLFLNIQLYLCVSQYWPTSHIFLASSSLTSSLNYICNMIYISKDMNRNNTGNDSFLNGLIWNLWMFICLTYHMLHVCHTRSEVGLACIYVFFYGFVLFSTRNSLMKGGISNEVSNSGVLGWRKEVIISEKPLTYWI